MMETINAESHPQAGEIDGLLAKATEHHAAGRMEEAEELYVQALHLDGDHPVALRLLGALAYQVHQDDIAVELLSRAVAVKPDYFDALLDLGMALCAKKRFQEGIQNYYKAMQLNPISTELYFRLANALRDLGRVSEADEWYRKTLNLDPDHAGAHAALAQS